VSITATVDANFIDLTGVSTTGYAQFTLISPTNQTTLIVTSTGLVAPRSYKTTTGASFSVSIIGNDQISDSGGNVNTYYSVRCFDVNNNLISAGSYLFNGGSSYNLLTAVPITPAPTFPNPNLVQINTLNTSNLTTNDLTAQVINSTVYADQYPGVTADLKIAAAIAALSSGGIVNCTGFGATTQSIANNLTVPANITLHLGDTIFSVTSGKTFTIQGPVEAPRTTLFSGSGAVSFSGNHTVTAIFPEWWGAIADGTTNNASSIQACFDALGANGPNGNPIGPAISFSAGTYLISTTGLNFTNTNGLHIFGAGQYSTTLQFNNGNASGSVGLDVSGFFGLTVHDISFSGGTSTSNAPVVLVLQQRTSAGSLLATWRNVYFTGYSDYLYYNCRGEQTSIYDYNFFALGTNSVCCVIGSENTAGVTSPFSTLGGSTSTTDFFFSGAQGTFTLGPNATSGAAALILDQGSNNNVADLNFYGPYFGLQSTTTPQTAIKDTGTGIIAGLNIDGYLDNCQVAGSVAGVFLGTLYHAMITGTHISLSSSADVWTFNIFQSSYISFIGNESNCFTATSAAGSTIIVDNGGNVPTAPNAVYTFPSPGGALFPTITAYALNSNTLVLEAATPTVSSGQIGLGTSTGFGNGSSGTSVTTTTKGTGTGPTTPQTVVDYLKVNVAGTVYWLPLVQ